MCVCVCTTGPDSPCTVMKDVTTHTRVMRLKLQSLEEHLEACVSELKKLCIREAVSMMTNRTPPYSAATNHTPRDRPCLFNKVR